MYEWQSENRDWDRNASGLDEHYPYTGIVWLLRGNLASRL